MSPSRSDNFTRNLKQDVVYWGNPVNDGYGGRTFADPVEMKVRWEDKHELFIDSSGQQKTSQAVVFVGEDVVVGGYLMLGTLSDLSSADESPLEIAGAYEIKAFSKIPDLKGESFVRNAWL
jgi:hypothetical protein